jgi:hypothetical protein
MFLEFFSEIVARFLKFSLLGVVFFLDLTQLRFQLLLMHRQRRDLAFQDLETEKLGFEPQQITDQSQFRTDA